MAIIMDGNRRFAFKNRLTSGVGHRIGKAKLEEVLDWVLELNIPWFTVYALSTENLNRPQAELDALFDLYIEGLNDIAEDPRIHANHVRVQIIGRRDLLPARVIEAIDHAEGRTAGYDRFVFSVCLAYGSREEILDAIRAIAEDHAKGELALEAIDEAAVSDRLYTADMPDPIWSSAPLGRNASPTSCCGRWPTLNCTSPTSTGPPFRSVNSSRPSRPSSSESAATEGEPMGVCDRCQGYENPSLAVDACVAAMRCCSSSASIHQTLAHGLPGWLHGHR